MLVQSGSNMVQNWSGMVPDTSGTLLGHSCPKSFSFFKKNRNTHETATCMNTDFVEHCLPKFENKWLILFRTKKTRIEIPLRLTCRTAPHLLF